MSEINIAGHPIGPGYPCFLIAEAGVNHNGSVETALELVDAAVRAGADAVKFQTFNADRLVSREAPMAADQVRNMGRPGSQHDMLRGLELSEEAHRNVMAHCEERGIVFLSSPFDEESADFLMELGVPAFKLPSGEITNLPFLAHVAGFGKPMVVSTGMADLAEVEAAVRVIGDAENRQLVLLHCVSAYPADPADVNLRAMCTMAEAFGAPVGYSDHTLGIEIALAAAALGACVIEKHFTLDKTLPGPDHAASLEPEELASLVEGVRRVEASLGDGSKRPAASEADTTMAARKSLFVARDLPAGSVLTADAVSIKRPGTGLQPALLERLVGRTLRKAVKAGEQLTLEALE